MSDSLPGTGVSRPVRVEDVAREAGVSPITVSRALRTPDLVRPETRERIAAAVERTGYVVNPIASTLRSGRSNIVSVFVSNLRNPHFANAMQGAIDAFDGSRFHLMFAQTGYSEQLREEVVESVLPFRPAAMMFTGVVRSEETRAAVRKLGVPVMEMWGDRPDPIDMLVGASGFEGGRLMGRHFAEQGFRHIAYSGHALDRGRERLEGFEAGLGEFGVRCELVLPKEGTRKLADGIAAAEEILERMPDCDAMFFGTDVLAAGAIIAAGRRGVAVPDRVAVAGYGNLDFTAHVAPGITSIHVSDYQLGQMAGRMLLDRLEGRRVENPVIQVPAKLEIRGSTLRR